MPSPNPPNPKVDAFLSRADSWHTEIELLRSLCLAADFTEDLKWGKPCYSYNGVNIVVIIPFKSYCSLLLCKGALLKDPKKLLVKAGENTQAARQFRFTSAAEIIVHKPTIKSFFKEAIAAEKSGLKIEYKKIDEHTVPAELQSALASDPRLNTAFKSLTPGRQRAYYIHISGAKQAATREARVKKCTPLILKGKGLND